MLLDVSYRLPAQLCAFVSEHVYAGRLTSYQASSSSAGGSRISRWVSIGAAVLACVQLLLLYSLTRNFILHKCSDVCACAGVS